MPLHPASPIETVTEHTSLADFVGGHQRLFVLTGAGCSTDSGIPDYRDAKGDWKRTPPVTYQAFVGELATRQRYWARSLIGWRRFGRAQPNAAHHALARLEQQGKLTLLLTQNVDRLHQAAGNQNVIDLHGRMDVIRCLACERRQPRDDFQAELLHLNSAWAELDAVDAPDGMQALHNADAVLVVGSSLMVFSGYRFVHAAARIGKPIAAVNMGHTRADALLSLKIEQPCGQALAFL